LKHAIITITSDKTYVVEVFSSTLTPLELEPAALSPHKTNRVQLFSDEMKQWIDGWVPVSDQLHAPTLHIQHAAAPPPPPITVWVPVHVQYGGGSGSGRLTD
jgi:hypothetical protein